MFLCLPSSPSAQKIINASGHIVVDDSDLRNKYIIQRQKKSKANYVRARSPSPFRNPTRGSFIRLKGLPQQSTYYEIIEFMRGIRYREQANSGGEDSRR